MMIRAASIMACIGVAALMTGCIDSTTTVLVRADGSGTVTEEVYVTKPMERMMQTLVAMASALGAPTNELAVQVDGGPASLRASCERRLRLMGEGVSLQSAEAVKRQDGAAGVKAVYGFARAGSLRVCTEPFHPLFPADAAFGGAAASEPAARSMVSFAFAEGKPSRLQVRIPWSDEAGKWAMQAPAATGALTAEESVLLRHALDGFRARFFVAGEKGISRNEGGFAEDMPSQPGRKQVKLYELNLGQALRDEPSVSRLAGIGPVVDLAQALVRYQGLAGVKVETRGLVMVDL